MNDAQTLKLAGRRAALHSAIRSGDAVYAARAAARLRVPLADLTVAELKGAREARRTLGRAIVKARLPRREEQPLMTGIAIPAPLPGSRRRLLIAALAVLGLLLLLGGGGPAGSSGSPDEAAVEQQQEQQTQQDQLLLVSRGRTVALPPLVAVVVPSATPTPAPTASATPAPRPTAALATATAQGTARRTATPGPTGAGTGAGGTGGTGVGGGGSGGTGTGGGGTGGGTGSGTGFPTPAPLPPVPPPGFGRFQILVVDAFTGRPIPGACVIIGTQSCDPSQPHTDANGHWAIDIPATTRTTLWDLYTSKPGYVLQRQQLGLAAGQTVVFTIRMRRSF